MDDTILARPDYTCLFGIASEQMGYFTTDQALSCGFGRDMLSYHAKRGRFMRFRRGLYRLRDYPSSMREEVMEVWLDVGRDLAVVSHESAMDLLDLSDVVPRAVHITVPRANRYLRGVPGARIHTTSTPLSRSDITWREGIRLTNAARSIVDSAEAGTAPEQIEMAVFQALDRALTTPERLREESHRGSKRVQALVSQAMSVISQ
jgi:predicted transcriptional regulator of viral defense system